MSLAKLMQSGSSHFHCMDTQIFLSLFRRPDDLTYCDVLRFPTEPDFFYQNCEFYTFNGWLGIRPWCTTCTHPSIAPRASSFHPSQRISPIHQRNLSSYSPNRDALCSSWLFSSLTNLKSSPDIAFQFPRSLFPETKFWMTKVWCLASMRGLCYNPLQSFTQLHDFRADLDSDRIDIPSYGIADPQRLWKMAIVGVFINSVADHLEIESKVPTWLPKLNLNWKDGASNESNLRRTHNLHQV